MLIHKTLDNQIQQKIPLPAWIEDELLSIFNIRDLDDLTPDNLQIIATKINECLTKSKSPEGYSKSIEVYALYYLPVNIYKIWRPLYDLLMVDQIPTTANLLELGPGPGTSTLGLILFYSVLAQDNPGLCFTLHLKMVEQHQEFIDLFQRLFNQQIKYMPSNLKFSWDACIDDVRLFIDTCEEKYDIIYESNLFNHNEHIREYDLPRFSSFFSQHIKKHGSLLLIEPAENNSKQYLRLLKESILQQGMTCFSPCCCSNSKCIQFASARVDITEIQLYQKLCDKHMIGSRKSSHSFDYAVFRIDGLTKYRFRNTGVELNSILLHIGSRINTSGYILTCLDKANELSVKMCDGSLSAGQQVWINIPKSLMQEDYIHCLVQGRGGYVKLKNAYVISEREIVADFSTFIEIMG